MIRKLLCKPCYERIKKIAESYSEPIVGVEGKAIGAYYCDDCNTAIDEGSECVATSLFKAGQSPKTHAWEYEYIIPTIPHRVRMPRFIPDIQL